MWHTEGGVVVGREGAQFCLRGEQEPALEELADPLPCVDFLLSQALVSYVFEYEYISKGVCVG